MNDSRKAEAWRRYRRLLKIMAGITTLMLVLGFIWLQATGTPLHGPFVGAVIVAVVGSLMLSAALMGLVFFSSLSGADDEADPNDRN